MCALINPGPFLKIFDITKKSELKRHCKKTTIFKKDFAYFVYACDAGVMPWLHTYSSRDFIPKHLTPREDFGLIMSANALGKLSNEAQKEISKISQIFEERRHLIGHLFFKSDMSLWHFFYFDQRDIGDADNHWEGGSHIHLLNYLWPNLDANTLWQDFNKGNPKLAGSIHIRYSEKNRINQGTE